MIDKNKQYRTRDGREVRIYATDGGGRDHIHGAVKNECGSWVAEQWYSGGKYFYNGVHMKDLIEVKPRIKREVWVNVYPEESGMNTHAHECKKAANDCAGPSRGRRQDMSELCEHETFKDVCGICHRDGVITRLRADNERLTRQFAEHADRTADDTAALRDENERLRAANRDVMLHWDVLKADYERLRAALEEIAAAKPQQIGDTGFQQGPLSLWMWAKRTARAALDGQPAPGKEEA